MTDKTTDKTERQNHSPNPQAAPVKWRVLSLCLAAVFSAVLFTVHAFAAGHCSTVIREEAHAVLREAFPVFFPGKETPLPGRNLDLRAGTAFQWVFPVEAPGPGLQSAYARDLVFVVPVSGLSGPELSVFYFSPGSGVLFLGNCHRTLPESPEAAGDTGISPGNLKKWTERIGETAAGIIARSSGMRAGSGGSAN